MQMACCGLLIKDIGLSFNHVDGPLGTLPEAGPQAVAVGFTDQPCLAVDDLESPFGASGHAKPAAVTFLLVDGDYLSFDLLVSLTANLNEIINTMCYK